MADIMRSRVKRIKDPNVFFSFLKQIRLLSLTTVMEQSYIFVSRCCLHFGIIDSYDFTYDWLTVFIFFSRIYLGGLRIIVFRR